MDALNSKQLGMGFTRLIVILLLTISSVINIAANPVDQKQKVIAAAIFKFIKFVKWEHHGTLGSQQDFYLCLQQYDAAFEPFTKRKVHGKPIKLHVLLEKPRQPKHCDALYLNSLQVHHIGWLNDYKNKATLTISEQSGFLDRGGIIKLGSHNNRLIFSINQQAAKANRLHIGFQLLSLAQHVIES